MNRRSYFLPCFPLVNNQLQLSIVLHYSYRLDGVQSVWREFSKTNFELSLFNGLEFDYFRSGRCGYIPFFVQKLNSSTFFFLPTPGGANIKAGGGVCPKAGHWQCSALDCRTLSRWIWTCPWISIFFSSGHWITSRGAFLGRYEKENNSHINVRTDIVNILADQKPAQVQHAFDGNTIEKV